MIKETRQKIKARVNNAKVYQTSYYILDLSLDLSLSFLSPIVQVIKGESLEILD